MPGLTFESREKRLEWALMTLFLNPCKNPTEASFIGALRVIQAYDLYYKTHPHPTGYTNLKDKLSKVFVKLAKHQDIDPNAAEDLLQAVNSQLTDVNHILNITKPKP
jgi:hypothetical protein